MSEEIHRPASFSDQFDLQQEAEDAQPANAGISETEVLLLEKLSNGDEEVFVSLIQRYHSPMLRLAMIYLPNRSLAEEVVQETWLGILQGLKKFEGRSSLKTWMFRILLNIVNNPWINHGGLGLDSTATRYIFADVALWLLYPTHQGILVLPRFRGVPKDEKPLILAPFLSHTQLAFEKVQSRAKVVLLWQP